MFGGKVDYTWEKIERMTPPMVMNEHQIIEQLDQLEFPVLSKHHALKDKKRK